MRYEKFMSAKMRLQREIMLARFRVIKVAFFTVCFDEMQIINEKE